MKEQKYYNFILWLIFQEHISLYLFENKKTAGLTFQKSNMQLIFLCFSSFLWNMMKVPGKSYSCQKLTHVSSLRELIEFFTELNINANRKAALAFMSITLLKSKETWY